MVNKDNDSISEDDYRSYSAALARIDERTKTTNEAVTRIEVRLSRDYVTKDEFQPVRQVVFGLVGTVLLGVICALVGLVVLVP